MGWDFAQKGPRKSVQAARYWSTRLRAQASIFRPFLISLTETRTISPDPYTKRCLIAGVQVLVDCSATLQTPELWGSHRPIVSNIWGTAHA